MHLNSNSTYLFSFLEQKEKRWLVRKQSLVQTDLLKECICNTIYKSRYSFFATWMVQSVIRPESMFFWQQLEMLKYMRNFHIDDQSAIIDKVVTLVPLFFKLLFPLFLIWGVGAEPVKHHYYTMINFLWLQKGWKNLFCVWKQGCNFFGSEIKRHQKQERNMKAAPLLNQLFLLTWRLCLSSMCGILLLAILIEHNHLQCHTLKVPLLPSSVVPGCN